MTPEQFDTTLRSLTNRRPFLPFVVLLNSDDKIIVPHPGVAFGGGVAGFVSDEEGLVGFACEDVRAMEYLLPEAAR